MNPLVVDASVVVDLLGRFEADSIEDTLFAGATVLAAPALLDVEVLQAMRRLDSAGAIPAGRDAIVREFRALRIRQYPHDILLEQIWSLRKNLTAYDAAYVALARLLDATLVTRDKRLAAAPNLGIAVAVP